MQTKTPWGDPDIQGTWTSDDCIGTPMNRPVNFGDRAYLTEQEIADRMKRLQQQHEGDLKDTVDANQRVGTGPPGRPSVNCACEHRSGCPSEFKVASGLP